MRKMRTRRKLSMTSLIDVIFLLLLFFMLTSTFSRFAEVELTAAGAGGTAQAGGRAPLFLKLNASAMSVNLQPVTMEGIAAALTAQKGDAEVLPVLVSIDDSVTAQRLTDLLLAIRSVPGIAPTVLGSS